MSTLSLDSSVSLFEPAPLPPLTPVAPVAPAVLAPRRHGRRAQPRARRASAASTFDPLVLVRSVRLVAVRTAGTGIAAAAVTLALATRSKHGLTDPAALASVSIKGLALAAILCAAWGFQDRARLGGRSTARAWYGTALVLALAHASWFEANLPGTWHVHLGVTFATFALDVVLVAAPALLGSRAGRPEDRPALS